MPHSFTNTLMHCVWSTKERREMVDADLRQRLWPFLGGIARQNGMKALTVGVADHVHLLLSLPATMAVAKADQLLKGSSSKWVHENFPQHRLFAWQKGCGAFSISVSQVADTAAYIETQEEHHRKRTLKMSSGCSCESTASRATSNMCGAEA